MHSGRECVPCAWDEEQVKFVARNCKRNVDLSEWRCCWHTWCWMAEKLKEGGGEVVSCRGRLRVRWVVKRETSVGFDIRWASRIYYGSVVDS